MVGGAPVLFTISHATLLCILDDLKSAVENYSPLTLVAHNVDWDAAVIHQAERQCDRRTGICALPRICTMLGTAEKQGAGKFMNLAELYESLFGREFDHPHQALADAIACGDCFWHLARQGQFKDYEHSAVRHRLNRSTAEKWADAWASFDRRVRSGRSKDIWRERRSRGSSCPGAVDELVLQRIRSLLPPAFRSFLETYAKLNSQSSAAYIKRALKQEHSVLLKTDTSWRCVVAYCNLAGASECAELAETYLAHAPKRNTEVQLELGQVDSTIVLVVRECSAIPYGIKGTLLDLCGGSSTLAGRLEGERVEKYKESNVRLNNILQRCGSNDQTVCGIHKFTFPYGEITVSIQPPNTARRLLSFLGRLLHA